MFHQDEVLKVFLSSFMPSLMIIVPICKFKNVRFKGLVTQTVPSNIFSIVHTSVNFAPRKDKNNLDARAFQMGLHVGQHTRGS